MNRMNEQLNEKRTESHGSLHHPSAWVLLWLFVVVFVLFSLHFVAIEIERNNKEPRTPDFHYITTNL